MSIFSRSSVRRFSGWDWLPKPLRRFTPQLPALAGLVCALGASAAMAQTASIPYTATAPTIDGSVDSVWSSATAYSITKAIPTISSTSDCSATYKALWDNTNLYLLIDVTDDLKQNDSTNPWEDDSVEVYVDGNNEKATAYDANDRQIVCGWGDTAPVEGAGRSITGVTFAKSDPTSTSYRIEVKIPWSSLGVTASSGKNIGIDVHVNDDDDGTTRDGKLKWNDPNNPDLAWGNPSVFGTGTLQAPPPSLPAGWSTADIGGPTPTGSAGESAGTWTIAGGGADIWATSDQFRYAYKDASGDVTIIANCTSLQNTDGWAKGGVMIRDGTAANAMYAFACVTPGNGVRLQYRSATGGSAADVGVAAIAAPRYLRLQRSGNSFTASYSSDGSTWSGIGSATVAMPTATKAGLALTSHLQGTLCTATFNNVSVTTGAPVGSGTITRELWTNVGGMAISDIPVTTTPNTTGTLTSFEAPTDWSDNYGERVRGYLIAPASGSYTFWIASDDTSELWLSTDANPANKVRIAYVSTWTASRQWTTEANQKSAAITLTSGGKYYIEALHKEGGGGDNLAVGWARPGQSTTAPSEIIPGLQLMPWDGALPSQVAAPSFSPAPGTYTASQSVSISTSTTGATIRYTTDGSTPSQSVGTVYSAAIAIGSTTTLKAIAYKAGMTDSSVTTGLYTINIPVSGGPNNNPTRVIGMNLSGPGGDNIRWPMFANIAKCGRYGPTDRSWDYNAGIDAGILDANGQPQKDFALFMWDSNYGSLNKEGGTYSIQFNGQATLNDGAIPVTYNSTTNTSTATWTLANGAFSPTLKFTSTKRTSTSATNTGITNLYVMRPSSPGASTSYSTSTVYTSEILNILRSNFHVLRCMDFGQTNGNDYEDTWAERSRPMMPQNMPKRDGTHYGDPAPGGWVRDWINIGPCWEYFVRLGNDAQCDIHITIPVAANDDYVTKLAQLIRYGSDANGNPYTSTQASPVYPPLDSARKVYVELSNELWNWGQPYWYQKNWMHAQAKATTASHPIRYDDPSLHLDENTLAYRWQAWRTVQISNIFRSVWGDANMMSRVRPMLMWQQGSGSSTHGMMFLHNYYNNGDGQTHVATPHPVNYFIWGGAGSFYNDSTAQSPTTVDQIFASWDQSAWARDNLTTDVTWAKTMGLGFYAYEGGVSLGGDGGGSIYAQAWHDIRMKQEVIDTQNIVEDYGSDGCNLLGTGGGNPDSGGTGSTWEYVSNIYDPYNTSPKMQGVQTIRATSTKRTPTVGDPTGTAFLAAHYARDNWWPAQHDTTAASVTFDTGDTEGKGYIVRASAAGTYQLSVQYSSASATTLRIICNGTVAGTISLPASGSAVWSTTRSVNLGAGVNGIRIQNLTSNITAYNIRVQ